MRSSLTVVDEYTEPTGAVWVTMILPSLVVCCVVQRRVKPEKRVDSFTGE